MTALLIAAILGVPALLVCFGGGPSIEKPKPPEPPPEPTETEEERQKRLQRQRESLRDERTTRQSLVVPRDTGMGGTGESFPGLRIPK